ncbi:MAG TPA: hypothetical protein VJ853_08105 [Thermoanaerobaculia bacterium]|nr:hypothetical protein [Thermoanaerobaculia bacterium]
MVELLNFDDSIPDELPRGPASVRFTIAFEDDDDLPPDDTVETEFVIDIGLSWSELIEAGDLGAASVHRPLVKLPGRDPMPCTSLTLSLLQKTLGTPSFSDWLDLRPDEIFYDWLRHGFFVTAHTIRGILDNIGISALSLSGEPPLRVL